MKKIVLSILILLILFGLSGCSGEYTLGSIENNTSTKMSMTYHYFRGEKEKKLTVDEGEPLVVSVDIKTESGTLDAYIINEDDEYIYEGHDIPTSSFTVDLAEAGKYRIRVEAAKHKGSYSFTW
jgi:hypothetical protein